MSVQVIRGDARRLPLPDQSVDVVVTSPPYFGLRSYRDGGEHYDGQIGSEPKPSEFVAALLDVTRECMRVLRPTGSIFVNLGDKYASYEGNRQSSQSGLVNASLDLPTLPTGAGLTGGGEVRNKSLMGIPWRYALACMDDLGLILREDVVWSKPNGLPESVKDRCRRSHEEWFHFTPNPRYYANIDVIRVPHRWQPTPGYQGHKAKRTADGQPTHQFAGGAGAPGTAHPLGALPGSVWEIPTQPLQVPPDLGVDHYAAFPTEWPKRIIEGWCPERVCLTCGQGRVAVVEATYDAQGRTTNGPKNEARKALEGDDRDRVAMIRQGVRRVRSTTIVGEQCGCETPDGPTRPGVVLDPFGGTGTTAMVADVLGRHGVTVDLSADYCRIAQWRTTDRNERARVLGLPKVVEQPKDQEALW